MFWYHLHLHGDVARQVGAGLVGAIIVEDQIDDLIEISSSHERLWVLNDPSSAERTMTGMDQMHGRVDIASTLGEIEDRTIVNETGMDHPFHLHV